MIFDCQLSRGRARAPGCQRCFEAVLIRTAIRFSSTAAALSSHASSMHHDTPSEEVAALAHAYGTGRTCLYRSAVDARLAGRLRARARGSCCGGPLLGSFLGLIFAICRPNFSHFHIIFTKPESSLAVSCSFLGRWYGAWGAIVAAERVGRRRRVGAKDFVCLRV